MKPFSSFEDEHQLPIGSHSVSVTMSFSDNDFVKEISGKRFRSARFTESELTLRCEDLGTLLPELALLSSSDVPR